MSDDATATGAGGNAGDAPAGGGETPAAVTFSQADLDRVAGQTRKEALRRWAKELGFEDPKAIEEIIRAKAEADTKAKTDLEKLQERLAQAEQAREAAEARIHQTLLRASFERAAMDLVGDVGLAWLAAREAGLLNGEGPVTVDTETGKVAGLDKALEKLLRDKPILKKAAQAQAAGTGGAAGSSAKSGEITPEQEAELRRRFGL